MAKTKKKTETVVYHVEVTDGSNLHTMKLKREVTWDGQGGSNSIEVEEEIRKTDFCGWRVVSLYMLS